MYFVLQPTMPLPSPPPNLQKTRLTAEEYFKAPTNSDEYDGKVEQRLATKSIIQNYVTVFVLLLPCTYVCEGFQ